MSQRVMVEFNLDMVHEIRRYPEAFHIALTSALSNERFREELLALFGANVITQRHHSTAIAVTQNGAVVWSEG